MTDPLSGIEGVFDLIIKLWFEGVAT